MENWYFILVPIVIVTIILTINFLKMEKDYKSKSREIQQKIEELKARNSLCQNKINIESFDSKKMNQITNDFLYLHNQIVKRYLR